MPRLKSPVLLITLLFISIVNYSQENNYIAFTINNELKENANAVIRDYTLEVSIEDVDKMIVTKRKVVTVLNKSGNNFASIAESYDNDTKITSLSAKIYDAFGNEIKKYKERDFFDVSAVDGGSLYSDAKVKYVNYQPISYPYTLVFESEYKTKTTGFIPWWFPVSGYYVAVEKSNYIIHNPKEISWRIKETNFDNFKIEKEITNQKLSYSLANQNAFEYENSAVSYRDFLPKSIVALDKFYLKDVYGEYTNWKEFGAWMNATLLKDRDILKQATKDKVLALVEGVTDPLEKAKIVYEYMQNKTRYISVQVGIGGWEPIAANEVDEVGYGDCKGLTNYTKALLDVVGVTSYYTIVYAQEKRNLDKDFSSMQGNHVILNLPNNGKDVWLECTNQEIPFGFLGDFTDDRDVLVIKPEGGEIKRTSSYKNDVNLQSSKATIQLLESGDVTASLERISKGLQYDDKFNLEGYTEEELNKYYKSRDWSYNNNLEIISANLENLKDSILFKEKIDLKISKYAAVNDKEFLFRVNVLNKNNYLPKRYRDRNLPLKISRGYKDIDTYKIIIPNTYSLEYLPENQEIKTKFGTYKLSFLKKNDTTFEYKRELSIKEGIYPKEEYSKYRSFRKKIAKLENTRIAITKNK